MEWLRVERRRPARRPATGWARAGCGWVVRTRGRVWSRAEGRRAAPSGGGSCAFPTQAEGRLELKDVALDLDGGLDVVEGGEAAGALAEGVEGSADGDACVGGKIWAARWIVAGE